jgi:SAM-dependent methyltransferase
MSITGFDAKYYEKQIAWSLTSARRIVPIILERFRPNSVVDVGCGTGAWLSVLKELGVPTVRGLDASDLPAHLRLIADTEYCHCDLSAPLRVERKFDLAISVEVAEHLCPARASSFISDLTTLADIVLFSAAIPFQGGRGHRNENWADFWNRLFQSHGFQVCDLIRPRIWNDAKIAVWYRQNLFLFVRRDSPHLPALRDGPVVFPLGAVHPEIYLNAVHGRRKPTTHIEEDVAYFNSLGAQADSAMSYGDASIRPRSSAKLRRIMNQAAKTLRRIGSLGLRRSNQK